jgi:hypothetical protein
VCTHEAVQWRVEGWLDDRTDWIDEASFELQDDNERGVLRLQCQDCGHQLDHALWFTRRDLETIAQFLTQHNIRPIINPGGQ